jgi:hypothetical protein
MGAGVGAGYKFTNLRTAIAFTSKFWRILLRWFLVIVFDLSLHVLSMAVRYLTVIITSCSGRFQFYSGICICEWAGQFRDASATEFGFRLY